MKIYDISKELFSAEVYPGDPRPHRERALETSKGNDCNLTILTMGSHNGTHMDAPYHFVESGRTVEQIALEQVVGVCDVIEVKGSVNSQILEKCLPQDCERLILKGDFTLDVEGASYLVERKIILFGLEAMTVAEGEAGVAIHRILLGADMVILESLVMEGVPKGRYILCAAPLKLKGLDGAPCRPFLLKMDD